MKQRLKKCLKELPRDSWRNPVSVLGVTPGRIPGGALVELPSGFLKQLAGKFLNKLRWNSWTPEEFWKELLWDSPRNSERVPG